MFRGFFSRKDRPLTGAPTVRRQKTYSAQSGYVYQYFYEGQRPFRDGGEHGVEFVFRFSHDRKQWLLVSVFSGDAAVAEWQRAHERELSSTERYAVAKMALFQAFDERVPDRMQEAIRVRTADLEAIIEMLGL